MDAFPDTQEYKSDKPVKLIRGADVSNGVGMDYDNVERTFKLRSRVQTTIQPRSVKQN
jgi:LPS export ABC transporter protein LptC